jgi:lipopolysaccharide heptosyltransferase II
VSRRVQVRSSARRTQHRLLFGLISAAGFAYRIRHPRKWEEVGEIASILVVRLDLLGDVVFTLTMVEGLRATFPTAHIAMLTLPYTSQLGRMSPAVDDVLTVDTNRIRRPRGLFDPRTWVDYYRVYHELRRRRFDVAISTYGAMGSLWAFLAGATRSTGYKQEAYPFLLDDPVPGGRHRERIHEIEYARRLALHVGVASTPDHATFRVPSKARDNVDRLLLEHGIGRLDSIVAVHAGSMNGSAKRWPVASWSRFIDELGGRTNRRVVLVGAESDAGIACEVQAGARSATVSLAGRTDIPELAALLLRADLVASGDSGPLHLASALGRPLLAVYGPTDPVVYGPYRTDRQVRLHRRDLPCSPCYSLAATAECPLGDPICMRLVTVTEMVESAVALLSGHD